MLLRLINIILYYFFRIVSLAILVYCIMSWFVRPGSRAFEFYRKLAYYIEPLFVPARKLLNWIYRRFNLRMIPIDFSPWLTIVFLNIIHRIIILLITG